MDARSCVLSAMLLVPTLSWAAPDSTVHFRALELDDGYVEFNDARAFGVDFQATGMGPDYTAFVDGERVDLEVCEPECESLDLSLSWEVAPLLSFEPYPPGAGFGVFRYGGGTLQVDFHGYGINLPGAIRVAIRTLTIDLDVDAALGGRPAGPVIALLGPGVIHESLARLLGVSQHTTGGSYDLYTDDVTIREDPLRGWGGDNGGYGLTLFVPEPGTLLLVTAALVACAARRRRFI